MKWGDIEAAGREKYGLSEEWHLCAVDAKDSEVMVVEFSKKGPRGAWLRGKENRFDGYVLRAKVKQ